jgi:hypothetical protein
VLVDMLSPRLPLPVVSSTAVTAAIGLLAFAGHGSAQGAVSPAQFATTEGTGNSNLPFGFAAAPMRYLQVHDGVAAQTVQGLAFRHDTTGAVRPAFALTLDVWMSTAIGPAANASTNFDANHGLDKLQVVTSRVVNVPGNDPAQLPGAWLLDVPFDTGITFPFAGNGASLCWEVHVTATTLAGAFVPFDAVLTQGSTPGSPGMLGTRAHAGCLATGRTLPMAITPANSPVDWALGTATQVVNASQLLSGGIVVWISGSNTTQWGGAPLPSVLPTSTGAPSGTCTLYTDLVLLTAGVASAAGTAQLQLPFAVNAALHGYVLPTQLLGLDAAANALGFTSSNLVLQQLVAPYPALVGIRRVYATNLGATGTVDGDSPLVTWFR